MITISTRNCTTEQLKHLTYGLAVALDRVIKSRGCKYDSMCKTDCKSYDICNNLAIACNCLLEGITEREVFEAYSIIQKGELKDDTETTASNAALCTASTKDNI